MINSWPVFSYVCSLPSSPNQLFISHMSVYVCLYVFACMLSHSVMSVFATPWAIGCQAPQSMELSKQEYWSGLPFSTSGDLPNSGIKQPSPALASRFFTSVPPDKPIEGCIHTHTHTHILLEKLRSILYFIHIFENVSVKDTF